MTYEGKIVQATGWGRIENDSSPDNLMKVDVKVISIQTCQNSYSLVIRYEPDVVDWDKPMNFDSFKRLGMTQGYQVTNWPTHYHHIYLFLMMFSLDLLRR